MRATALAALMAALRTAAALAQVESPTMTDATVVARGALRVRTGVEWTRFDALLGPDGKTTVPLGASLTGFLDVNAVPLLLPAQNAVQALARAPALQLGIGTLTTTADSRTATVPISIEYGLASWLTLGANVPIVDTRTVITAQLNGLKDSSANVGPNPAAYFSTASAYAANATVVSGVDNARQQLSTKMASCAATPSAAGCASINARLPEANALLTDADQFENAATTLYGTDRTGAPGEPFVPLATSAAQKAIDTHLSDLRAGFTSFGFSAGSGAFAAANGPAANTQLFDLVNDPSFGIGLDSVATTEQLAIGDVELSAVAQLFNTFPDTINGLHFRGAVGAVVRLGTGHPARAGRPLDVGTGDGQTDLEARAALDVSIGARVLTTLAGTITVPVTSARYDRLPGPPLSSFVFTGPTPGDLRPGTMIAARLNPRFMVTRAVSVGALMTATHRAADLATPTATDSTATPLSPYATANPVTMWNLGLSFSYSNIGTRRGTGDQNVPAELTYTHLELAGANAGGLPRTRRDAIEVRFYLPTR